VVEVMTRGNAETVGIWLPGNQPVEVGADLHRKSGKLDRRELTFPAERTGEGIRGHADTLGEIPVKLAGAEPLQALERAVSDAGHAPSIHGELGKSQSHASSFSLG
jgi:hypothetical protein